MTRKRARGYIFESFKGDHLPLHVHIYKDRQFVGRWDIEGQAPMKGDTFQVSSDLRKALKQAGYLRDRNDDDE